MATAKEQVRHLLDTLPDDATLEDVQHSIYVRERVESARRAAAEGQVLDEHEIETRMQRWLDHEWELECAAYFIVRDSAVCSGACG